MEKYLAMRARYERYMEKIRMIATPEIVVWGPGSRNIEGYQKRKCVKKAIKGEVPNGRVFFPEEHKVKKASSKVLGSKDLDLNELLQAGTADIIIVVDFSETPGEEIARYSTYRKIAPKMFVVAPKKHKSGYKKAIRDKVTVHYVKSKPKKKIKTCDQATRKCVEWVMGWCLQDFLSR